MLRLTPQQQAILEGHFKKHAQPSVSACKHYSKQFGRSVDAVTNWFSERREREVNHFNRNFLNSDQNTAEINAVLTLSPAKEDKMMQCDTLEYGYIPIREEDEDAEPNDEEFIDDLLQGLP